MVGFPFLPSYAGGVSLGKTLNSSMQVRSTLLNFFSFLFLFLILGAFIPYPAEYGAEEFGLDAVPTLGWVRDLGWV